ncbi:hypothetical protein FDJ13_gp24 [Gordonia phage Gustav]|uniref:Uncharacterized protein n=1 Tax=Gordonia phage Gustav TaxID=2047872 RepID=A0A2H4PA39_9CAUD|nr:hypothetical protein FDJ13_gp24 [Gordonia phage Gustav]ATW59084.1 hypothetical protein PHIRE_GUSTAV_24 [Gordonia phage Gustav]
MLALIVSFGTAAAGVVTAWRRAPSDNVDTLSKRVKILEEREETLSRWQVAARLYILTLRNALADRGIPSPEPPDELEIHREAAG